MGSGPFPISACLSSLSLFLSLFFQTHRGTMRLSSLPILLLLTLFTSAFAKPSFLAPTTRFSQAIQKIEEERPLFDVRFHGDHYPISRNFLYDQLNNPASEEEREERVYSVTDHRGVKFHCLLPVGEGSGEEEEGVEPVSSVNKEVELQQQEEELNIKMAQLIDRIGGGCVVRNEGWWSYEFCPAGTVRQYHENRQTGGVEADISLGKSIGARHWSLIADESAMDEVYIKETFTHGQKCDLPPQNPRQTEIRWFCDPQILPPSSSSHTSSSTPVFSLVSIEEPSSCAYLVKIATGLVCDMPGVERVVEETVTTHMISCYPAESE